MNRRTVQKILPARYTSFDQQFWPVLVAVTVLCGIGFGAVLTILRGPWMWGSLIVLPLLAAGSIFLLFHIDDAWLRRSLQLAIVVSLALHLLVLVIASVVSIFKIQLEARDPAVALQPKVRTIEISDQRAAFVWEETNAQQTPEPEVETPREETPTTETKPQPIPVKESQPTVQPQFVKRETPAETLPRQNRELSQRRRQTENLKPQPTQQLTGQATASAASPSPARGGRASVNPSRQAESVAKQSTESPAPSESAAAPRAVRQPEIARRSSTPQRAAESETPLESAPQPASSAARIKRSTPRIPVASTPAPAAKRVTAAASESTTKAEPSKLADQLTRRSSRSEMTRATPTNQPRTELNPRTQIARSSQRLRVPRTQAAISNPDSSSQPPRRTSVESRLASSPVPIENRSRAPESKTASNELNSKTLSISRSTAGVAGSGRSANLERSVGGMTSPARRTSDSARRNRTESRLADARMLSSSQKSENRRTVGAASSPSSALKSDTRFLAKLAGSSNPSKQSLESSAAQINAASTQSRDESSAEKGTASVDIGATKIVADQQSRKRSGGGQPDISRFNPESTRRSREQSSQQPSLIAAQGAEAAAPTNPSSAPTSSDSSLEPSTESMVASRQGGDTSVSAERGTSRITGEMSDAGESRLADANADSRRRAQRASDETSLNDEDDEEENRRGQMRTRVSQAPITNLQPGMGIAKSEGRSNNNPDTPGDSPMESSRADVSRTASQSLAGTKSGRSTANDTPESESMLPSRNRTSRQNRRADSTTTGAGSNQNPDSPQPSRRSNRSQIAATMPGTNSGQLDLANPGSDNPNESRIDSQSVSVSRSQQAAMAESGGNRLDIDAIEGPAGLGERPADNAGIMTRPASRESEQIQPDLNSRFRKREFGGIPAISPNAVIAKEAFRNRAPSTMSSSGEPTTEAAIRLGLQFLARVQTPNGSWSLRGFDTGAIQYRNQLDSDTAATGLALLAFQGAGYNHREFKYAVQVDRAIQWLVENQSDDGGLYVSSDPKSDSACRLYSHGIAALAITEAYGMTQDPDLKQPAQRAIDYIIQSQDPSKGGWRYYSQPAKRSTDTSVSGWMMMALQSGRLAGLDVGTDSFDSIDDWLDVAADPENESLYRYNPYGVDSKGVSRLQGRLPSASMTSVGLLMRIYSGWDRSDPRLLAGADYLLETKLPGDSTPQLRDTYYWYYATQVLKHVDGPRWERWNGRLRPLLIRSQEKSGDLAGSWDPYRPVPDRWGAFGGRLYVTTMNLLSLEVRYRMLPLYKGDEEPDSEKNDGNN